MSESTDVAGPPRNIAQLLDERVRVAPEKPLLSRRAGTSWEDVTAAQFRTDVLALAKGLVWAGLRAGDRVGLLSKTRYEWTLCDFAVWAAGAVTVPIYETSSAEQIRWILSDAGAVACIVETAAQEAAVGQLAADIPALRSVWAIGARGETGIGRLTHAAHHLPDDEVLARHRDMTPDTLATVIYTSGTTGRPKGCQLTHGNFLAECRSAIDALPELFEDPDASTLLFLPLAHVFARMIQVAVVMNGTRLGHSDTARLLKDLGTFQPTFVLSVPRVFEKVHDTARRKAVNEGRGRIFDLAASTAVAYSAALEGRGPGLLLRVRRAIFDRLVYGKLRAALGGRTRWAVSGGAPLNPRLAHFFRGAGVTVLEGYGLTETTAATTVNTRAAMRIGTVGRPMPRIEVAIADDGEVLIRGGHVFRGYWQNPDATAAVLSDGWFATGDLGSVDADGFLTITGRKKELLVTSSGRNVSPAPMEDVVRANPLVSQCMVVGDARPNIACLVTLDPDEFSAWLAGTGRPEQPVDDLVDDPDLRAEIQKAVDAANAAVSGAEAIKRFRILPGDFTEENGLLTPTMKLRRNAVLERFGDEVEALYGPAGGVRR